MGHFYIELIHFRIVESGVDFDVTDYHLSIIIRPRIMGFYRYFNYYEKMANFVLYKQRILHNILLAIV